MKLALLQTHESDEALMESFKAGERAAFRTLFHRYSSPIFNYLLSCCSNRADAEDLFQETFLRLHARCQHFQGRGSFKSWLYTIATNLVRDSRRRRAVRRGVVPLQAEPADPRPGSERVVAARESARIAHQVLETLDPLHREPLLLVRYQGLSYKEAASVCGCSLSALKMRVNRAHRMVTKRLTEMGAIEASNE